MLVWLISSPKELDPLAFKENARCPSTVWQEDDYVLLMSMTSHIHKQSVEDNTILFTEFHSGGSC